ncbi:M20 aminoacylase family protein [Thalassobaculum sp. OXR-137]|uniref:M20 aminoacylase family protein n=1 Tax=Thalassobaculum sp. OXR-137 TaxID=3100173 RepID=UPI002AC8CB81|nr:M20 aminoacylase family protein [Thalassobaculum sp. OXR-137]WPZ36242.1 M20 aminoacylase family protein [Thalassobaculum sp. OXR-137]
MPIVNRIAEFHDEMTAWRQDLHTHPELGFEEHRTSDVVAAKLESFGIEVHRGLAGTGVVGVLKSGSSGRTIGLRADMDALPILERGEDDRPHRSVNAGVMHACGHDGHTTMLLGAAKYLAETKNFDGTVHFIFQPAEEGKGGGDKMVQEGLFDQFPCETVFGMHNIPGIPVGSFAVSPGPMMAARDNFEITIKGKGSHGAMPHHGIDPVLVGAHMVMALQSITSRNLSPQKALVLSVTQFHAGHAFNVVPDDMVLRGTCRVFDPEVQNSLPERITRIMEGVCATFGASAELNYMKGYPATINDPDQAEIAAVIAGRVAGDERVDRNPTPMMGAEDFSYMLNQRPGAYIWAGNGDTAGVHHPDYDFNDAGLPHGASFWAQLVEDRLKRA